MDDDFDLFNDDDYFSLNVDDDQTTDETSTSPDGVKKFSILPNATIFLIDCHKSMQHAAESDISTQTNSQRQFSLISRIIKVIFEGLKLNIISRPRDLVSIVFYNTIYRNTNIPYANFPGVYVYKPLQGLSAGLLRDLSTLPYQFSSLIGCNPTKTGSCSLSDALWACSQVLSSSSINPTLYYKSISLFTANDDPSYHNRAAAMRICERFEDLSSAYISFELFDFHPQEIVLLQREQEEQQKQQQAQSNDIVKTEVKNENTQNTTMTTMTTTSKYFDRNIFYNKILDLDDDDDDINTIVNSTKNNDTSCQNVLNNQAHGTSFSAILARFKQKLFSSRSYATVPMFLGSYSGQDTPTPISMSTPMPLLLAKSSLGTRQDGSNVSIQPQTMVSNSTSYTTSSMTDDNDIFQDLDDDGGNGNGDGNHINNLNTMADTNAMNTMSTPYLSDALSTQEDPSMYGQKLQEITYLIKTTAKALIGVNLYSLQTYVTIPTAKYSSIDNVPLSTKSIIVRTMTGDQVYPHQIRRYFTIGTSISGDSPNLPTSNGNGNRNSNGNDNDHDNNNPNSSSLPKNVEWTHKVPFSVDELKNLKNFGTTGIRILCTKPADWIVPTALVSSPYFLHPNEHEYPGSSRAFTSVYHALLKTKKVAVCHVIVKANVTPFLAALVPSIGSFDIDSQIEVGGTKSDISILENTPTSSLSYNDLHVKTLCQLYGDEILSTFPKFRISGLYLVPLPYANDLRAISPVKPAETLREAMDDTNLLLSAVKYVKALTLKPKNVTEEENEDESDDDEDEDDNKDQLTVTGTGADIDTSMSDDTNTNTGIDGNMDVDSSESTSSIRASFPLSFTDPKIQKERSVLTALALQTVATNYTDSLCMSDVLAKRAASLARRYISEVKKLIPEEEKKLKAVRRPRAGTSASASATNGAASTTGTGGDDDMLSIDEARKKQRLGTLSKLTVKALGAFLGQQGLKISGKKADLVDRITEYLDKNP